MTQLPQRADLHTGLFCNHSPNLNTAFLQKCVAGWSRCGTGKITRPRAGPLWPSQRRRLKLGRAPRSWASFSEGRAPQGCSCREEGGKRDKNIQKVGSIIGRASGPSLCELRTVGAAPSQSETLHFAGPSYSLRLSASFLTLTPLSSGRCLRLSPWITQEWSAPDWWHLQGDYLG